MKDAEPRNPRLALSRDDSDLGNHNLFPSSPQSNSAQQSASQLPPEGIECGKFFKSNRAKTDVVIVALREYQGHQLIDIRLHWTDSEGRLRPGPKGLSLTVRRLPELLKAIAKAHATAIELGLVAGSSS